MLKKILTYIAFIVVAFLTSIATASESVTYYHNDLLGSPVAATDAAGNRLWQEQYQPYGSRILNESAASDNSRWYTGHPHDDATGLTYAGARYYDPNIGRFMAIDPVDVDSKELDTFGRYTYVGNNPYGYIDPDGRAKMSCTQMMVAGCGGLGGGGSGPGYGNGGLGGGKVSGTGG
jgi:RHS repeat-associated protein